MRMYPQCGHAGCPSTKISTLIGFPQLGQVAFPVIAPHFSGKSLISAHTAVYALRR